MCALLAVLAAGCGGAPQGGGGAGEQQEQVTFVRDERRTIRVRTVAGPSGTPSTGRLVFDEQPVGTQSPTQAVEYASDDGRPMDAEIRVLGQDARHFLLVSDSCSGVLIQQCRVEVSFAPRAAGRQTALIVFGEQPSGQGVVLVGEGVEPQGNDQGGQQPPPTEELPARTEQPGLG